MRGLTNRQVVLNREKYGANIMPEPAKKSAWDFFVDVFRDKINVILLVMTALFAVMAGFGYGEFAEAIGIGSVLIIVATVNVITKMRSQKATLELRRQASKLSCNVLRNGKVINLDSSEIVVDDIVLIQAGETIPADGYIIAGQVSVNNSILNGESEEVHKSVIPNFVYNRKAAITAEDYTDKNQVFSGTTVHGGMGTMRVTRVGMDTENAKILKTLGSVKEVKTTLQIQLDKLAESISKIGGICAVAIAVLITVLHFISGEAHSLGDTIYIIVSALTLALTVFVAAVPDGLPFIIEIITSQNARKMTQANLLAKNPHKIPEAGNIQLLCTDKTGTITYGRMMPIANYTGDGTDIGFAYNQNGAIEEFTRAIIINGRAMLDADGKIVGGNSTERALFSALNLSAQKIAMIKREIKVIKKVPFDSAKKFSFTTVRFGKTIRTYIMAAPEIILDHTSHYINKDGKILPLRKSKLQSLMNKNNKNAMRSIAVAYYDRDFSNDVIPKKLVFVSLSILRDEVRSGVLNVVESLHKSGVQVMMITGDNLNTAHMIAKQSGIITSTSDIAISAKEFDSLSNERARKMLSKIRVLARATPYTKLRVIELARENGLCIGMCGDGTNDAPALKAADIGFAMGDSTDVCKSASDIIILDNNFISIANSILIGRTFMHNIVSFLRFQLPINFMLVGLSILFPLFLGLEVLLPVHILIINIVMDSLNSLAFGGESPREEYMVEPVAGKKAPLITSATIKFVLYITTLGLFTFALTTTSLFQNLFSTYDSYTSALFALLVIMAMLNGFCVRAPKYNIFSGLKKNPMFVLVSAIVFIGTYICVTFGGSALHLTPLNLQQWAMVVLFALMIIPVNFIYRALFSCLK